MSLQVVNAIMFHHCSNTRDIQCKKRTVQYDGGKQHGELWNNSLATHEHMGFRAV